MTVNVKYVLLALFCVFCGKYFTQADITLYQSLQLLIIGGLSAFYEWKDSKKLDAENKILISALRADLDSTKKIQADIINSISSLKIGNQRSQMKF